MATTPLKEVDSSIYKGDLRNPLVHRFTSALAFSICTPCKSLFYKGVSVFVYKGIHFNHLVKAVYKGNDANYLVKAVLQRQYCQRPCKKRARVKSPASRFPSHSPLHSPPAPTSKRLYEPSTTSNHAKACFPESAPTGSTIL